MIEQLRNSGEGDQVVETLTYYAIEILNSEWREVQRFEDEESARLSLADSQRYPMDQSMRIVKITREVIV